MLEKRMQVPVYWRLGATQKFRKLSISIGIIRNVHVEKENDKIRQLKRSVYEQVRANYRAETLKDDPTVRAYRDFYWKLGIDPTKTRPSGEALLRRVLHGNDLPTISTVVDAYNLASLKTIVPVSGFDRERLEPPFTVRFAENGEPFMGIAMNSPITLTDRIVVLADEKRVLCIYPYEDADYTKITLQTKNVLVVGYGAQGVTYEQLEEAVGTTLSYIKQVAGGETQTIKVFSSLSK